MLVIVCLVLLLGNAAAFNMNDKGPKNSRELDVDEPLEDGTVCFWACMCSEGGESVLEMKEATDVFTDKIIKDILEIVKSIVADEDFYPLLATIKKVRDDIAWVKEFRPMMCALNQEKKDRYVKQFLKKAIEKFNEICNFPSKDCTAFQEFLALHNAKVAELKNVKKIC